MTPSAVRRSFRDQAVACRNLGSPLTADICDILADALREDQGDVAHRVLNWPSDPSGRSDALALRLCGGLHALVLKGECAPLTRAYDEANPSAGVLLNAIAAHETFLLEWLQSPPQTNEVGRSATIIAAARFIAERYPLPIRALELGASAGLNLNFHRYHLMPKEKPPLPDHVREDSVVLSPEWTGHIPDATIEIDSAEGVDLRPVDPVRDRLRLLAYCWHDQVARMERLRAALDLAQRHPPKVEAGDAAEWLERGLAASRSGLTLIYHTIARQYFPPETQAACDAALRKAGALATRQAPLAHFSMESDDGKGGPGAALVLRLWDGEAHGWHLGRADFHGRWVDWHPKAF